MSNDRNWFIFFIIFHFMTSMWLRFAHGLDMAATCAARNWNFFWQTLPYYWLDHDLVQSILNLHSQPPLLNIMGGLCIKLFGPYYIQALNTLWILFGSVGAGLVFAILRFFLKNRVLAVAATFFLSAMPSWYLYEAYMLYTLPSAVLILAIIAFLCRYADTRHTTWLLAAITALNALILLRSAYHLVLLAVFIPLTALAAGRRWPRVLSVCLLASLLSTGWYLKNAIREGFFGSSSWVDMNLYRNISARIPPEKLFSLAKQGQIHPMCYMFRGFSLPYVYRPFGFNRPPAHPVQAGDDFNNSILPEVYSVYGRTAATLRRLYPAIWRKTMKMAYGIYVFPSSEFLHVKHNLKRLGKPGAFWVNSIEGYRRMRMLYAKGISRPHPPLYYILPILLALYAIRLVTVAATSRHHFSDFIRTEWPLAFCAGIIAYTTIVSCAGEYSENHRFRFMIELPTWILAFTLTLRPLQWAGKQLIRRIESPGSTGAATDEQQQTREI